MALQKLEAGLQDGDSGRSKKENGFETRRTEVPPTADGRAERCNELMTREESGSSLGYE